MTHFNKLFVILSVATILSLNIYSTSAQVDGQRFGMLTLIRIRKCWSNIRKAPGCASEIVNLILNGGVGSIRQQCCDVIEQVTIDCWRKMFPDIPQASKFFANTCAPSPRSSF